MTKLHKAVIWATVILGFALAAALDLVPDGVAKTLLFALPALAWVNIAGQRQCAPCPIFGETRS